MDVINADTNTVIDTLMNPISSSETEAIFEYVPTETGNYQFSCWAMSDDGDAEDCPIVAGVVTEPGQP
jgi:hypothetical protein